MVAKRVRLAERRKSVGYSQERLAERLGVERSTVVRWEAGGTEPQPWVRPMLAEVLRLSLDQLADLLASGTKPGVASAPSAAVREPFGDLVADQQEGPEQDDMNRRELLRLMSMAGALVATAEAGDRLDWERLEYFTSGTRRLDPLAVEEYAALNAHLWRVFAMAKTKRHTYPLVREQLGVLVSALQRSHDDVVHRKLCALVADLFQLAGEVLFDSNHYTEAAHCYTLAATASKEAGAFDLWACALTRHAFIEVYERQFTSARPMLEFAAGLARRGDSALSTRHWVSAVQAQTLAGLGDLEACQRALDHADHVHQLTGRIHTAGWLRFDGSRLPEERGACFVALRRADLAEHALSAALHLELSERRRGGVLTDLAVLGLQQGDIEQLVSNADAAIEIARDTGSGWLGRKLFGLQLQLAPLMTNQQVSQLGRELASITRMTVR